MIFTYYIRPTQFYLIEVENEPIEMKHNYYFKLISKFEYNFPVSSITSTLGGSDIVNPLKGSKVHFSMSQAVRHLIKQIYEEK